MKKKLCFDIDGVICKTEGSNYSKSKPYRKSIKLINELYDSGHTVIIFTARYMGRNSENQKKAYAQGYNRTYKQLKKWDLKFHKLIMGKPSYDIFVDDKSYDFNKKWINKLIHLKK